jgi:hypothetical protein
MCVNVRVGDPLNKFRWSAWSAVLELRLSRPVIANSATVSAKVATVVHLDLLQELVENQFFIILVKSSLQYY